MITVKVSRATAAALMVLLQGCGGGQAEPVPQLLNRTVAFMGDSITAGWDLTKYYNGKSVNAGVSGNTTAQMLARLRPDVLSPPPGVLVILGGINDLQSYPTTSTVDNIRQMAAQAKGAGSRVILCSVMAIDSAGLKEAYGITELATQADIEAFNQQLITLASENGYLYADYYDAMLGSAGKADTSLLIDGLHPNGDGYKIMWSVLEPLIIEDQE